MEVVFAIVGKIGEYLVAPIGRQFGYVLFYKSHVRDFKKQVEELEDKKVEVEGLVSRAKGNGDLILPGVTSWLEDVDKITQESNTFFPDEAQANKRCFNAPFSNYKLRYKRGKKATKNIEVAKELQKRGSFERVSLSVRPPATRFKSTEGVEDFQSRKATLKQVMKVIEDPKVKMIGIYGIGGVGKTTLVKQVAEQAEVRNQFNEIVMAVVSQTVNLEKIQQQIAEMLGLKFERESQLGRAERLHSRLKQIEKVLIILDDIWSPVNLGDIGIPFGVDHEGCKIVITSRSQDVCNQMATQKNVIKVGILEKEEAWNLFRTMAGDRVDSPEIKPLASKVVKRCSGLPIAIVTIARALKDKSLSFWKDAANGSRMSREVSSTLQLSYDYLESEEAKSLFLLCCIYGEDHNIAIEDLWKYGMGLGSFQDVHTVEAARNRTYALAEYLKYSCLLQDGRDKDYVKMHDVVRDFAISVASKDEHGFLVRSGPRSKEFPDSSQFIRYTTISLTSDVIQKIPDDKLECPKLELLYLECTHPLLQIPDKFFSGMKKLKVLVMSKIHFKSFSPSLVDLENLQTLCLSKCNLEKIDLSIIGKLKGLKFLSIIDSDMEELPKEIGELIHLKLLDLSGCYGPKIIPRDVILRLSKLEGLYMGDSYGSFRSWEIEGQSITRSNVSIGDLKHLPVLTSLEIVVPNEKCLLDSEDLFKNLARFKMSIGGIQDYYYSQDHSLYSKALKLASLRNIPLKLLRTPLRTTEYLYLNKVNGLGSILYDLEAESVLKCLTVMDCGELEYVFSTKDLVLPATVFDLEELELTDLPNLKGLSHGQLSNVCFRNLRVVRVRGCSGLKHLFSHFKITDLQELCELRIKDCQIVEEIFGDEIGASLVESIVFPSLQVLELSCLPKLINFCSKNKCMGTHMKNPLFNEKVMFPLLKKLEISMTNVEDIWDHQLPGNYKSLSFIKITVCYNLKSLFRPSMASSLGQLQEVVIDWCDNMKTIISKESDADEESCMESVIVFPQLRRLIISRLSNLASFYQTACPTNNLEDLTQPLPLFGEKVMFPVLEKLQISEINLKNIWDHDHQLLDNFKNLSSINIFKCNSLKSLFWSSMASSLGQLHEVLIDSCEIMKTIISKERDADEENCIVFSQLRKLTLKNLPNLASFYQMAYPLASKEDLTQPLPLLGGQVGFPVLEKLEIQDLRNLKSIFSPSVIRSLEQLQTVTITKCESMETVIANEKQGGEEDCIEMVNVFPKLRYLRLKYLPNFTGFYLGTNTLNWPSLKLLRIRAIGYKLDHHLFNKKVLFPSLEKLVLADMYNKMIWHPQILAKSFSQLRVLQMSRCYEEEVVVEVEGHEVNELIFPHLRELKLETLPKLKHIMCWDKYPRGTPGFQSLVSIDITDCDSLKSLIPPWVASTLVQLQQLSITSCEQMETVIAKERQGEENCLNWPSLKILKIAYCPAMKRFTANIPCPQKPGRPCPFFHNKVLFPSLEKLVLADIHNLKEIWHPQILAKSFSQLRVLQIIRCSKFSSVVSSSLLQYLQSLKELYVSDCDLLEEVVVEVEGHELNELIFPHLRELTLEKLPKLKHIMCWDKYPLGTLGFQSVIQIHVIRCDSLKSLISPSVASTLVQLQQLSITSCEQLETVIAKERQGEENCLNWPSLKILKIVGCPAMKIFTGNIPCPQNHDVLSKEAPEPGRPCPFFHSKVALTSLVKLHIINMKCVEEIFDNQLSDESFFQLNELIVRNCDKLLRVIPSNLLPRLKKLERLVVTSCNLVEEISEQGLEEGQATTISFTDLEELELENLPNLKIFCSGKHRIECPSLYLIKLMNCPKIETFSSGFTSAPVLKIIHLEGKKYMLKDDLNTTVQQIFHEKDLSGGEESSNEESSSEESSNEESSSEESSNEES